MMPPSKPLSRLMPSTSFLLNLFIGLSQATGLNGKTTQCFQSRPDICAPILNVTHYEADHLEPGYLFVAPMQLEKPAPYIYSESGELIWSGAEVNEGEAFNWGPCQILGEARLCMIDSRYGRTPRKYGPMITMRHDFSDVQYITNTEGEPPFDEHELQMINGGNTALVIYYEDRPWDLSSLGGPSSGYLSTSGFQEIDMKTRQPLFSWDASDHISMEESYMSLTSNDPKFGDGYSMDTAWDYFHQNSADKNDDGDYLISSRHMSTIYKISGKDGSILWRLGGKLSDFTFDQGLNFSSQHHARWRVSNESVAIISFYNNGFDDHRKTAESSSAIILRLDLDAMHATLITSYAAPHNHLSYKEGSVDILPNGNALTNWGGSPYLTEHLRDGSRIVFEAQFLNKHITTYRAFKRNFTSIPLADPDVLCTSQSEFGSTVFYVSWNGATEVQSWRVYGSQYEADEFELIGSFNKAGFETRIEVASLFPWATVEAVDVSGRGIRNVTSKVTLLSDNRLVSQQGGQIILKG